MNARLADLISALPDDLEPARLSADEKLQQMLADVGQRALPVGRLHRLWILGSMQAQVAVGYLAAWLRSWPASNEERDRRFNEAHLKAALKLIGGMSYLRGAVMKVGQVMANCPDVAPREFADVLGRLFFEAPPMHYELIRERVRRELGGNPKDVFDDFDETAIAAASLGQVHRARLKGSGIPVAVKIQYPGIARAIRNDIRNMMAFALPMRLHGDWDNVKQQIDGIRRMLDLETDYEHEAENARLARSTFSEADGIIVPRVYEEFSTGRVLTMDLLEGKHLDSFMAGEPSQDRCNAHGEQITRSAFRLSYHANMMYADPQPGNYIFLPDGRLGLIDFGCCHRFSSEELQYMTDVEVAAKTSAEAEERVMYVASSRSPNDKMPDDEMQLMLKWARWVWEPMRFDGAFDFSDLAYFRVGMDTFRELVRRKYVRSHPVNTWLTRNFFGVRAMLYHLRAKFDFKRIADGETTVHV